MQAKNSSIIEKVYNRILKFLHQEVNLNVCESCRFKLNPLVASNRPARITQGVDATGLLDLLLTNPLDFHKGKDNSHRAMTITK
jgi:hypothetical protein